MNITFSFLTQSTTPIIGWIAKFFGIIMTGIYTGLDKIGIQNIGLCVIIFTIFVNICMIPLTIHQQKTTKINNIIQPEIKKIQSKYKGKNDTASQQKQQDEIQAVYDKYGFNMMSGCLPLVIQLPILYGLYAVIRNVPAYVTPVRNVYMNIVTALTGTDGFLTKFADFFTSKITAETYSAVAGQTAGDNYIIDILSGFTSTDQWTNLQNVFSNVGDVISTNLEHINHFNNFLGMNLAATPSSKFLSPMIIIPILACLTQFASIKILQSGNNNQQNQAGADPSQGMMKSMNYTMPIISLIMCFMLPIGLGLYWVASAVVRTIITMIINKKLANYDAQVLIDKSLAKKAKKQQQERNKQTEKLVKKYGEGSDIKQILDTDHRTKIKAGLSRISELDREEEENTANDEDRKYAGKSVYEYEAEAASAVDGDKKKRKKKKSGDNIPLSAKVNMVQDYEEIHPESRRKKKKKK